MRYSNEIKVGIVVIAGLALITFGYFKLRGVGLGAEIYYVKLNGAAAIAQGNDVRLQGVKIGQVQEVGFDPIDQRPLLTLAVRRSNPPFKLLKNYRYSVQSAGIVGENYFDIRGEYQPTGAFYVNNNPDERIPAEASSGLLGVTDNASEIAEELRATIKTFNTTLERINSGVLNTQNQQKLAETLAGVARLTNNASQAVGPDGIKVGFGDAQTQASLRRAMQNVETASRLATRASRNIEIASQNAAGASSEGQQLIRDLRGNTNGILSENRGQIRTMLGNVSKSAENIAGLTETLDFALKQGGFKENAQLSFQSLRRAAENVEIATAGLRKLG
jgi:ABC-type transporter Mla subunit MlaD